MRGSIGRRGAFMCVLAACGGASPAHIADHPLVANDVPARCAPYLEATGVTYDIPPDALVTFTSGTQLVVAGRAPGDVVREDGKPPIQEPDVLVVAPESAPAFAASDPGRGIRAYFADDTDLGDGVTARAGVPTIVRTPLDGDQFVIDTLADAGAWLDGLLRITPCGALATSPPRPPSSWVPRTLATVVEDGPLVSDAGASLGDLESGETVDLVDVDGSRALVRYDAAGYLLTGWVDARAIQRGDVEGWGGGGSESGPGMFGRTSWWKKCKGISRLRAGAPLATGAHGQSGVTTLPSLTTEVDVRLIGADDDDRRIEIEDPLPGIEALDVWVAVGDLSADCQP